MRVDLSYTIATPDVKFLLVGDSIIRTDGWADNTLTKMGIPFLNRWVGNQDAVNFNDQFNPVDWGGVISSEGITHIIVGHGFADINFATAESTMAVCDQIYSKFKAIDSSLQVYKTTISPSAESSDSWSTAQNQTVNPGNPEWDSWIAERLALNTLIRENIIFDGIIDLSANMAVDSTNTLTLSGNYFLTNGAPNWPTSDAVHLNSGIVGHLGDVMQVDINTLIEQ